MTYKSRHTCQRILRTIIHVSDKTIVDRIINTIIDFVISSHKLDLKYRDDWISIYRSFHLKP